MLAFASSLPPVSADHTLQEVGSESYYRSAVNADGTPITVEDEGGEENPAPEQTEGTPDPDWQPPAVSTPTAPSGPAGS